MRPLALITVRGGVADITQYDRRTRQERERDQALIELGAVLYTATSTPDVLVSARKERSHG